MNIDEGEVKDDEEVEGRIWRKKEKKSKQKKSITIWRGRTYGSCGDDMCTVNYHVIGFNSQNKNR